MHTESHHQRNTANSGHKIQGKLTMKTTTLFGAILIVIGIIAFAYQGITYTTRENVVDLGPLKVTTEKSRTIPLPPIVGGVALLGGIVLLAVGRTSRS